MPAVIPSKVRPQRLREEPRLEDLRRRTLHGPDTQLINQILSTGASLQEISSIINSVTGLGAISGVKAMTVDFQATRPT